MLECMQSLGATYKENVAKQDYEYEFYETYLINYASQENENESELIKVSDEIQNCFMSLNGTYSASKTLLESERGTEDKLADSFMFYISTGVIVLLEDGYYINTKKLFETTKQFQLINEQNGISLKKGSIK